MYRRSRVWNVNYTLIQFPLNRYPNKHLKLQTFIPKLRLKIYYQSGLSFQMIHQSYTHYWLLHYISQSLIHPYLTSHVTHFKLSFKMDGKGKYTFDIGCQQHGTYTVTGENVCIMTLDFPITHSFMSLFYVTLLCHSFMSLFYVTLIIHSHFYMCTIQPSSIAFIANFYNNSINKSINNLVDDFYDKLNRRCRARPSPRRRRKKAP